MQPRMSEGMNLVTLLGNLGADPELRQTQSGPVLKFRLATPEVYFDKEQ
jgi:single-stranded DNA-binding protein